MNESTPLTPKEQRESRKGYLPAITALEPADYKELIAMALREDEIERDVSTFSIFRQPSNVSATIVAKASGIVSALEVCRRVFLEVDPALEVTLLSRDGEHVQPMQKVVEMQGNVQSILRAERVSLNFLSMLSGISTLAERASRILQPMGIALLDTRKTIPGYRRLSKYAVTVGGGINHRHNLSQMGMIKDNHIAAAGSISGALRMFREQNGTLPCEVEIDEIGQLQEALSTGAEMLLLDNMNPEELKACVEVVKEHNRKNSTNVTCEASGGYHIGNLTELAGTGVDYVSMGALTNQITPLDFSLDM